MIFNTPFSLPTIQFLGFEYGFYWFHLSSEIPQNSGASFQLNGLEFPVTMVASKVIFPRNCMTVDTLQKVLPSTLLTITAMYTDICSNQNFETSLLGIRLDNILSPLTAFSARAIFNTSTIKFRALRFDQVIVDEGSVFAKNYNEELKAKQSGIYVFSINLAITTILLRLTINNRPIISVCACDDRHYFNVGYSSRATAMFTLNKNDIVKLEFMKFANNATAALNGAVTFNCFRYSLATNNPVAWSVASAYTSTNTKPKDYYPFQVAYVNISNPWQAALNKVIVPISGIYFVHLTGYFCGSEKYGDSSEMHTLHNGYPIIILRLSNTLSFVDCITRSRSIIINLTVGDELKVKTLTYSIFRSSSQHEEGFTGFLLQEIS